MGQNESIPTFTPPTAPIFTPPTQEQNNGPVCYHHNGEPAVARCARCGKYICKDCAEAYGVTAGEYAGKHLCYDCCEQIVADNIAELTKNKQQIKTQFIISLVGMCIGFLLGFIGGIAGGIQSHSFGAGLMYGLMAGIIYGLIGGVFLTFMKLYLAIVWESIKAVFGNLLDPPAMIGALIGVAIAFCIGAIKCMFYCIRNTIEYIQYLKKTDGFIESDTEALNQMRAYMEYTLVRNNNKGVDLEDLMNEGSELFNNSYAQAVRANGEEAADAALRQATTMINERGEIIRDFRAAA